jgi:putative ABC transport system permease protein
MSSNLRPIVSALLRNRTGALLVAIQIAIALAVLVNAVYVVHQRIEKMSRPTLIDDQNMFGVSSAGFTERFNYDASLREDLDYLRGLPGVVSATPTNAIPLSQSGSATSIWTRPEQKGNKVQINYFSMDEKGLTTLGVRLLAGRDFRANEILPPATQTNYSDFVPQLIVTDVVAKILFPNENALGKTVYTSLGNPATITGVIDNMIGSGWPGYEALDHVAILPQLPRLLGFAFLVRTEPGRRDAVMRAAEEHMSVSDPNRVVQYVRSVEYYKKALYLDDRNMEVFLITVTALLVAIASLGIFGLATFNVSTRTKQIGTRRAVGARRRDILNYFMVENAMITTAGIALGSALALAVGYWLSLQYKLPRLDLYYLAAGVPVLWIIGQLAVWQPARKASAVSPSVATRTV